jgi:hypothetical protein
MERGDDVSGRKGEDMPFPRENPADAHGHGGKLGEKDIGKEEGESHPPLISP